MNQFRDEAKRKIERWKCKIKCPCCGSIHHKDECNCDSQKSEVFHCFMSDREEPSLFEKNGGFSSYMNLLKP